MKFFSRLKKSPEQSYLSKMMIGLGYGLIRTKDLLLNEEMGVGTQDAMDMLSIWIGRELMKEMLEQKEVEVSDSDERIVNKLTDIISLGEELDIEISGKKLKVVVQKCQICPKRVGGYDLEGNTACPVGGLLTGAFSYIRGIDPTISKKRLQTGEICHVEMEL
jgi:hypothetical protein